MPINVSTTNQAVEVSTSGQTVAATVSGGQGPPGPTGATGPAGPQGPQGPAGPAGSNATATTDASQLVSGTLPDARLSSNIARTIDPRLNVTWPVRAVHVGGLFKVTNGPGSFQWLPATWPTGDFGDLATLATVEHATQSVTVDLTATRDAILAANPGWSLVRSSLEVALIDCDNRIVGWGTTELNGEYGPTHGSGGHVITLSVGDFPSIPAQYKTAWVLSDDAGTFSSNASYVINRPTPYKFVAHRALDIGRYDWTNIANRPTLATIATSGSASDLSAGTVPVARLPVGQTAASVAAGNDARFRDPPELVLHIHTLDADIAEGMNALKYNVTAVGAAYYSASTRVWTVQKTGLYAIQATMVLDNGVPNSSAVNFGTDNDILMLASFAASDGVIRANASGFLYLSAGDQVQFLSYMWNWADNLLSPNNGLASFNSVKAYRL